MKNIASLGKMSLEKSMLSTIYGGRTVERSDGCYDGVCMTDKIITRNNGSVKIKIYIS